MSTFHHTCEIPASVDAVFAAIADPARLARWWGPDGFTNTFHTFEFRAGGAWLFTMHGPDGKDHPNESKFLEIVPGKLVRIQHLNLPHFELTIALEASAGGTRIVWDGVFENREFAESMRQFLETANEQNLVRLAREVGARNPPPAPSLVESAGARLALFEEGGGRDPVLLLHGGPGVPDYLSEVAAILAPAHRVARFDQRGTGRSTCASDRYELEDYVNDVDAVRRALGVERLHLFGHSWGGLVAQLYASRHPERVEKLLLCNSSIGVGDDWRVMERAVLAHNRRRSGLAGFARLGLEQGLAMLPGRLGDRAARRMMARVWRNYFDPPERAPEPAPEWLAGVRSRPMFATRRAALAGDPAALSGAPATRMLILFGERDIYGTTPERLVARYPGARVVTLPGAGHLPWLQNRNLFAAELRQFFSPGAAA